MHSKTISQSPTIFSPVVSVMDFPAAIAAVIDGARITKQEWNDPESYGMLRDNFLMIHRDGKWHRWLVNDGDLFGQDWVVVEYGHRLTPLVD